MVNELKLNARYREGDPDWEGAVQAWSISGLKKLDFCKERNLDYRRFKYYTKKYSQLRRKKANPFVSGTLSSEQKTASGVVFGITLPNGVKISLNNDFDTTKLEGLIQLLWGK